MKQTTLFPTFDDQQRTKPAARRTDTVTSHIAAERIEASGKAGSDRVAILDLMRSRKNTSTDGFELHGWTSGEIAEALGDGWTNVRASRRLPELETQGHIVGSKARTLHRQCTVKGTLMVTWHLIT